MAYRPDDPYNTSLRNINQGQNMQMAELTDKQKKFIDQKKFPLQEGLISPSSVYETITNPDLGVYDTGIFGIGAQEPTTKDEYNKYLKSIGISGQVSSLDDDEYDFSGIEDQIAGLNIPLALKAYLKNRIKYGVASTGANILLESAAKAAEKKAAEEKAAADRKAQQQKTIAAKGTTQGSGGTFVDRKTGAMKGYEKGAGGGKDAPSQHFYIARGGLAQRAPRYANGGLINFYRYGGFI